jgi:uncharacterized membrane protein
MTTISKGVEVDVPASVAYDAWTQFESFPKFMEGIEEVRQRDDRHLHWRATIAGKTEEWDAEITEQIPNKRIAWRSESGAHNAGVVTFHRLSDDRSRVMLQLEYAPERMAERVGSALGVVSGRVEGDLRRFKDFVEAEGDRMAGWRGEIPAKPDAREQAESRAERGAQAAVQSDATPLGPDKRASRDGL